jgi:hypothetical protein
LITLAVSAKYILFKIIAHIQYKKNVIYIKIRFCIQPNICYYFFHLNIFISFIFSAAALKLLDIEILIKQIDTFFYSFNSCFGQVFSFTYISKRLLLLQYPEGRIVFCIYVCICWSYINSAGLDGLVKTGSGEANKVFIAGARKRRLSLL